MLKTLSSDAGSLDQDQTDENVTLLIERIKTNLRNGSFKIIVLMDEVPPRLEDVIHFINEKSKFTFCAIDIGYYRYPASIAGSDSDHNDIQKLRIMVPQSHGLEVKKELGSTSVTIRLDEGKFFEQARSLAPEQLNGLRKIFDYCVKNGDIHWETKSFTATFKQVSDRSLISFYANGRLQLYYGRLQAADKTRFVQIFSKVPKISEIINDKKGSPMCMDPDWLLFADDFISALHKFLDKAEH